MCLDCGRAPVGQALASCIPCEDSGAGRSLGDLVDDTVCTGANLYTRLRKLLTELVAVTGQRRYDVSAVIRRKIGAGSLTESETSLRRAVQAAEDWLRQATGRSDDLHER